MDKKKTPTKKSPIVADKELFRLWFEFYKLAVKSTDDEILKALKKSRDFYKDWGDVAEVYFDDWWRDKKSLFLDEDLVRLGSLENVPNADYLTVLVPKHKNQALLVREFRELIKTELAKDPIKPKIIKHKYVPTEIKGVKRDAMRMMLDLEKNIFSTSNLKGMKLVFRVREYFSTERYKRKKNVVPMAFQEGMANVHDDHSEESMRNVRRYRQKVRQIILNVALGQFPGKY
jgi:hypothetical protein